MRLAVRRRIAIAGVSLISAIAAQWAAGVGPAGADEIVISCGPFSTPGVFAAISNPPVDATASCPGTGFGGDGSGLFLSPGSGSAKRGQNALWQATAPAGLKIVAAIVTDLGSEGVNAGNQGEYGGDFYWAGGSSNIHASESSFGAAISSGYFGIQLVCGLSRCSPTNIAPTTYILAQQVALSVRETSGPQVVAPSGLWQAKGWVRGSWPLVVWGNSPSGLCGIVADFANQPLPGTSSSRSVTTWHECAAPPIDDRVNMPGYSQGPNTLHIGAWDAAGETVNSSKTVHVDNQQPTVSLVGPSDAPSTAGTQYVTATATAGPSGVDGISCSVDGTQGRWYPGATARVPVSGIGQHQVRCVAENNAIDGSGAHGASKPATFAMKIGVPTVTAVAFSKLVDRLRCRQAVERLRVKARWVHVRRHGKLVRVHERAHTKQVKVTRCHARTARRRVKAWVTVRRHGKTVRVRRYKTIRVLLKPHVVNKRRRVVRHGKATTVNGWLGTTSGVALGGQTVDVLTAADNGRGKFRLAAVTTTAAKGGWSAHLPAGPSRLVTAAYAGGPTTEGSIAAPVHLVVPAKVKLISVSPRRVAWGGTVRLVGQLKGGYLPAGGALVRLRIGLGSSVTTYGVHEHVTGNGRFLTTYTFGAGDPATHRSFWFQLASLPMGDYPYAPANSRRISVLVGGHP